MARKSKRLPLEGSDDGVGELLDTIDALAALGRAPKAGHSALGAWRCYRRLCRWLVELDLADELGDETFDLSRIEKLCERNLHGRPKFPAAAIASWATHLCVSTDATAQSIDNTIAAARRWLRYLGWAVNHLSACQPDGEKIKLMVEVLRVDQPARPHRPARPITPDDLNMLVATVDDNAAGWNELAVEAMKTHMLTTWTLSFRAGESLYRLRWSMIDLTAGEEGALIPAGLLKTNVEELDLPLPHRPGCNAGGCAELCTVAQLHRWRQLCSQQRVPIGPDALVFPSIRTYPPGRLQSGAEAKVVAKFGDTMFIADPIADAIADTDDPLVAEGHAMAGLYQEYGSRWATLKKAADFGPRHKFESAGMHGNRRGFAQEAYRNGAHLVDIMGHLGHGSIEMTVVYLPSDIENTTGLLEGIDKKLRPISIITLPADVAAIAPVCEIEHDGIPCGRGRSFGRLHRASARIVCHAHFARWQHGHTGDHFTRPITLGHLPDDAVCEVEHDGIPCNRGPSFGKMGWYETISGDFIPVCHGHYERQARGETGDDFTRPIGLHKLPDDATCEVQHHGVTCGAGRAVAGKLVQIRHLGLVACNGHYSRYAAGKRGDHFTRPIVRRKIARRMEG